LVAGQVGLVEFDGESLLVLQLALEVLPEGLDHEVPLLEHGVAVDELALGGVRGEEGAGAEDEDAEPVAEGVDWEDQDILFEEVELPGPALHVLVVLLDPLLDLREELRGVAVADDFLAHVVGDEFLEEEGGVEVELVAGGGREEGELEEFGVGAHDDVVEVGLGAQLLEVLGGDGVGLALGELLVVEGELALQQLGGALAQVVPLLRLPLPLHQLVLLLLLVPLEQLVLPPLRELRQLEPRDLHLHALLQRELLDRVEDRRARLLELSARGTAGGGRGLLQAEALQRRQQRRVRLLHVLAEVVALAGFAHGSTN
jgi:hypothetical protein